MTEYTTFSKMARVHAIYISMMCRVISSDWKQGWTNKEMKAFSAQVCEFKYVVMKFFSVCTSIVYTMNFHFLDHLVEDLKRFGDVSVLDASLYKQFRVHKKTAYQESSRRKAARMQRAAMLMKRQQRRARPRFSTDVESSSQSVVYRRPS